MRPKLLAAVAATAAVCATGVGATPTPLSPAPGSSTTSTHPVFRWTLPPTEFARSIAIAKSPALVSTGEFVTANIVDVDDLEKGAMSWTPIRPLPVGTYWWHVASRDATQGAPLTPFFTGIAQLTISLAVSVQSITVKWAGRQFLATVSLKANVPKVNLRVQLLRGNHVLASRKTTTSNFLVDEATDDQSVWTVPSGVKRGTPLRLVVTLTVKGATATAVRTKTFRAP